MAAAVLPKLDYGRFSKHGELLLASGVVTILFVMLVPLPTFFLDILLCVSISISLLVLITTMFMTSPLEFTIFPSLLLVTTLLRLALNVPPPVLYCLTATWAQTQRARLFARLASLWWVAVMWWAGLSL